MSSDANHSQTDAESVFDFDQINVWCLGKCVDWMIKHQKSYVALINSSLGPELLSFFHYTNNTPCPSTVLPLKDSGMIINGYALSRCLTYYDASYKI